MSCEICGQTDNLKSCGRCLKANYCGREHQLAHWKDHKRWCVKNGFNFSANSDNNNNNNGVMNGGGEIPEPPGPQQIRSETIEDLFQDQQAQQQMQQSNDDLINYMDHQTSLNVDDLQTATIQQIMNVDPRSMSSSSNNNNNYHHHHQQQQQQQQQNVVDYNNPDNNHGMESGMADYAGQSNVIQTTSNNLTANNLNNPATMIAANNSMVNTQFINNNPIIQNRDFVLNNLNKYCQIILRDMNKYGFCVIDDFLQNGDLILNEVSMLYEKGLFQAGQVVNIKANSNSKLIRGDRIIWVEGNERVCHNIGFLVRILDSIITRCNTMAFGEFSKYKINRRTKAMIACYPGNFTKYVRHVDNPNNDGRCITSIYYLNKDYVRERDGGVLRLFPQMNDGIVADIEPKFNRVIFFWSDRRNPHEVMPSTRMRFAITVWYFDANERAKAIEKYKNGQVLLSSNDKDLVPF